MKKVININFQGRVIPIEETACDILKQYVESLRKYFANEEGRDEIINDIESRIAELFSEELKKGKTCITDGDIETIIASIGRPEDFEGEDATFAEGSTKQQSQAGYANEEQPRATTSRRLYRDENDKILGGVCSGIASYLRIDPAIIRILFALVTIGGFGAGFLIYILLWAILPSEKLDRAIIRKRLFRNPDDKVIAGVASGIAAYFDIAVWIPRLVFALPLVISIFISIFRNIFWNFNPGFSIVFGSFGSTFFIVYLILWIVIPQATSASEKLEMRGEKVDLNSIKNTIQEDLGHIKSKAEKWGEEFKDKAEKWGKEFSKTANEKGKSFGSEVSSAARTGGSRLGHAIGVIFKAFFLFVAGLIAFGLLMGLLGIMLGGINVLPLKNFFLDGFGQNFLAWATVILFLAVPVIGLLTWIIRRIIGVRSKKPYLGYTFAGLWIIGLFCAMILVGSIARSYKSKSGVEEKITMAQPAKGKLYVKVEGNKMNYYRSDWFGFYWDDNDGPFYGISEDSLLLRTVRIRVVKSADSNFHAQMIKFSHGRNPQLAEDYANRIAFTPDMGDSILIFPDGFSITKNNKFHNQQVLIILEVPVGKRIEIDKSADRYRWFNVDFNSNRTRGWSVNWDDNWNMDYSWRSGVEYLMTNKGLKSTEFSDDDHNEQNDTRQKLEELEKQKQELEQKQKDLQKELQEDSNRYKYQPANSGKAAIIKTVSTSFAKQKLMDNRPLNISSLLLYKLR